MSRNLDLVVFGATGFTGKLMVDYLANNEEASKIRWGISGRNKTKLLDVLKKYKLQEQVQIIEASVDNEKSLENLCSQTRLLINAVGPFAIYGEPVVKACLKSECHYLDITGEPAFINKMVAKYHDEAKRKGIKIVHSVGFDSAPADLGVQYLLEQLPSEKTLWTDYNNTFVTVDCYVKAELPDMFSFGTFSTIVNSINSISIFGGKKVPTPLSKKKSIKNAPKQSRGIRYENTVKSYIVPFSTSDPTIVNRSAELNHYFLNNSAPFIYSHFLQVEKWYNIALLMLFALIIFFMTRFSFGAKLLLWLWKTIKGDGPKEGIRENGYFLMTFLANARSTTGIQKVICTVGAKGDPGYVETSKWTVQAALCMLDTLDGKVNQENQNIGGVLTPAACLGVHLRQRLEKVGMSFETKHISFTADDDDEKTKITKEAKKYVYMPDL
jgi:short subunit dehydrogenase-like uncharacterized protein